MKTLNILIYSVKNDNKLSRSVYFMSFCYTFCHDLPLEALEVLLMRYAYYNICYSLTLVKTTDITTCVISINIPGMLTSRQYVSFILPSSYHHIFLDHSTLKKVTTIRSVRLQNTRWYPHLPQFWNYICIEAPNSSPAWPNGLKYMPRFTKCIPV